MSDADNRRAKAPKPSHDDPELIRICNRCGAARSWLVAYCVCGSPEFRLPVATVATMEVQAMLF